MIEKQDDSWDDGRVIASMDVDGMRQGLFRVRWDRHKKTTKKEVDPSLSEPVKKKKEADLYLTKKETSLMMRGMWMAYLVVGGIFALVFGLFFLFCQYVWFR